MIKKINTILCLIILSCIYTSTLNYQHLPIQENGRIKPLDSFARNQLLKLYGKTSLTIYDDDKKFTMNAIDWLMPILAQDYNTLNIPVFKIENPDVADALKLTWKDKPIYTYNEINDGLNYIDSNINNPELIQNIQKISQNKENELELIEKQLLDLSNKRHLFNQLYHSASILIPNINIQNPNIANLLNIEIHQTISYAHLIIKINQLIELIESRTIQDKENLLSNLGSTFSENPDLLLEFILNLVYQELNLELDKVLYQSDILKIFPSHKNNNTWISPNAVIEKNVALDYSDIIISIENLFEKYINKKLLNPDELNSYEKSLTSDYNINTNLLIREVNYNKTNYFYWSLIFYILTLVSIIIIMMLKNIKSKYKIIPFILLCIGFLYNAIGLILRMIILSRPPVSTLYESIIFVAFISVLLAIILEIIKKDNLSVLIGAIAGIILHYLSFGYAADGDTFGVLVAVLNSNFWLATHVTTITTGYGTTIIASLIGHIYLLKAAWQPSNSKELKSIFNIMLATTFIALFFTLFGTILGGIWGDQSWGRFWGWDPKENGALLIVMWLLMMLHLKISGLVKGPGYALGLVLANITVALAWFGVNLLSVGLHNYGFTEGAALNLLLFVIFELLFGFILYSKIRLSII